MSGRVHVVCCQPKGQGRVHWRTLAEWPVGGRIRPSQPECLAGYDGDLNPASGRVELTAYTFRCPDHGMVTVPAVRLAEAYREAEATHRRVDLRVVPRSRQPV